MVDGNYGSVMMDGGNEDNDDNEDDGDYEQDENIENNDEAGHDDDYENIENNNNDHNVDKDDDENVENNGVDDDNLLIFIQQNILDNWSENVRVDPDDPTLTKEQQTTLFIMTKCRCLMNMIRKSSVLTLYFNHRRKILKEQRNLLHDVCTRWNSTYLDDRFIESCSSNS